MLSGLGHAIPNAQTFLSNGWDFDDVKTYPQRQFDLFPKGEKIPEVKEEKEEEK